MFGDHSYQWQIQVDLINVALSMHVDINGLFLLSHTLLQSYIEH